MPLVPSWPSCKVKQGRIFKPPVMHLPWSLNEVTLYLCLSPHTEVTGGRSHDGQRDRSLTAGESPDTSEPHFRFCKRRSREAITVRLPSLRSRHLHVCTCADTHCFTHETQQHRCGHAVSVLQVAGTCSSSPFSPDCGFEVGKCVSCSQHKLVLFCLLAFNKIQECNPSSLWVYLDLLRLTS